MTDELARVIDAFLAASRDAQAWAEFPDQQGAYEEPDCDVMSKQFLAFAAERGLHGTLVHVRPPTPQPWYSDHYFAVFDGTAIDWTARQFYNVPERTEDYLDPLSIPVPLVFAWPGTYPLNVVRLWEVIDA